MINHVYRFSNCSAGSTCTGYGWTVTLICIFVCAIVGGTIIALSVALAVATEPAVISKYTEVYGLTDNHIYPFKGDFCQDLRATSTNRPNLDQNTAFVSFLNSRPPLTSRERFHFSASSYVDAVTNFRNWNFVLNAGSTASFVLCFTGDQTHVIFNLIRGTQNFQQWVKDVDTSHTLQSLSLGERCQRFTYDVTIDANYYFVFYVRSTFHVRPSRRNFDVNFDFDRTLYSLSPDLVIKNCSFPLDGGSSCSMGIPVSSGYVTFISFETTLPVDYNDGANIHFTCTPRGWLYAIIVIVGVFVSVTILSLIIYSVKVLKAKYKKYNPSAKFDICRMY